MVLASTNPLGLSLFALRVRMDRVSSYWLEDNVKPVFRLVKIFFQRIQVAVFMTFMMCAIIVFVLTGQCDSENNAMLTSLHDDLKNAWDNWRNS